MAFSICPWEKLKFYVIVLPCVWCVLFQTLPDCSYLLSLLLTLMLVYISSQPRSSIKFAYPSNRIYFGQQKTVYNPSSTGETLNMVCNILIWNLPSYLWTGNLLFSEKCGAVPLCSTRSVYMPVPNVRLQIKSGRYLVMNMLGRQEHPLWEQHRSQGLTNLLYRFPAGQLCIEEAAKSVQSKRACILFAMTWINRIRDSSVLLEEKGAILYIPTLN